MFTSLKPGRARQTRRAVALLAFGALALTACTGGPGSEEDLVTALTRGDGFTQQEAECIAAAVFIEWAEDEDALGLISGAADYDELVGPNGVEGFGESFERAVTQCANAG